MYKAVSDNDISQIIYILFCGTKPTQFVYFFWLLLNWQLLFRFHLFPVSLLHVIPKSLFDNTSPYLEIHVNWSNM